MHRPKALLLFALFCASMLPLGVRAEANLPLFNPDFHIVPDAHEIDATCPVGAPLGLGGTLQLIQNAMNAGISLGVMIAILVIVYAGALWMLSPTNPENHSKAKQVLTNAVFGLIIVLGAWIAVDFVMRALYSGDDGQGGVFGPWNEILVGGDACVRETATNSLFSGGLQNVFRAPTTAPTPLSLSGGTPVQTGSGACSPETIQAAASAGGYALTEAQSKTFSCIAKAESSCGRNLTGARTVSGQSTTATGMFQVVMGYNDQCHNLNIPVCTAAAQRAGWTGSGNLNCSSAFKSGKAKPGMEALANACRAASTNIECNASAAACLLKQQPNFKDWTADSRSSKQQACVAKFAGG